MMCGFPQSPQLNVQLSGVTPLTLYLNWTFLTYNFKLRNYGKRKFCKHAGKE